MSVKAKINITLGISGPFLCSATAPAGWGLDASFDRNYCGAFYIDRSHIKGKLREALREMGTSVLDIDTWFGKGGELENGCLILSDFYCTKENSDIYETTLTRTRMDRKRKVVDPNALMSVENAFPMRGSPYKWTGCIDFYAPNAQIANSIYNEIALGLKWIAAFGAEKGVGFGLLKTVETSLECPQVIILKPITLESKPSLWLTLKINPSEPLLIGGKKIKTNYMESESIITGSIIKGALAEAINSMLGVSRPASIPIDKKNEVVHDAFPRLAEYFERIRFTHAFPTTGDKRPVVIPYSTVTANGGLHDVACCNGPQLINGESPTFQIDWKGDDFPSVFGWALPLRFTKTRTAIDKDLRKAQTGNMFTYQYVCPVDEDGNDVTWISMIRLPEVNDVEKNILLQAELEFALNHVELLGKRRSKVKIGVTSGKCPYAQEEAEIDSQKNTVILTLQSDALMVNPDDLIRCQTSGELNKLYKKYWDGKNMEMMRFFAYQKLLGGYLVTKNNGSSYYPFYLTGAGSVFILQPKDKANAKLIIEGWQEYGLPVTDWVKDKYAQQGRPLWNNCPFLPENGFGEVTINLKWHFDKKVVQKKGGSDDCDT